MPADNEYYTLLNNEIHQYLANQVENELELSNTIPDNLDEEIKMRKKIAKSQKHGIYASGNCLAGSKNCDIKHCQWSIYKYVFSLCIVVWATIWKWKQETIQLCVNQLHLQTLNDQVAHYFNGAQTKKSYQKFSMNCNGDDVNTILYYWTDFMAEASKHCQNVVQKLNIAIICRIMSLIRTAFSILHQKKIDKLNGNRKPPQIMKLINSLKLVYYVAEKMMDSVVCTFIYVILGVLLLHYYPLLYIYCLVYFYTQIYDYFKYLCFVIPRLLEDQVKSDPEGKTLVYQSSQFTEHVFAMFKKMVRKHCNNQPGWLSYIAKSHDAIIFGALKHNLIDLKALKHARSKNSYKIIETSETKKHESDVLNRCDGQFKTLLNLVNQIELPNPGSDSLSGIPIKLQQIIAAKNKNVKWKNHDLHNNHLLKSKKEDLVQPNNNNLEFVDSDSDSELDDDTIIHDPKTFAGTQRSNILSQILSNQNYSYDTTTSASEINNYNNNLYDADDDDD